MNHTPLKIAFILCDADITYIPNHNLSYQHMQNMKYNIASCKLYSKLDQYENNYQLGLFAIMPLWCKSKHDVYLDISIHSEKVFFVCI